MKMTNQVYNNFLLWSIDQQRRMNMDIWVVGTLSQPFLRNFSTETTFSVI